MITSDNRFGENVIINESSSVNNTIIGSNTKIAKRCSIFGHPDSPLVIGDNCYFGMNTICEGYNAPVVVGSHVSCAQNVNIMSGSGPNASERMQRIFPIVKKGVSIGDHTWIGASVIILPGVNIGKFCFIHANSLVHQSFPDFSIIGGSPARLIRTFSDQEKEILLK
jgi:acetyltransferase-like isoleucine patch superfamily enzyme